MKSIIIIELFQVPIIYSVYRGLKGMAQTPVESMKEGGLWWFSDLTVPDPFYVMPAMACTTLLLVIEVGADARSAEQMGKLRYVLRAIPFIAFPFMMNFEAVSCIF